MIAGAGYKSVRTGFGDVLGFGEVIDQFIFVIGGDSGGSHGRRQTIGPFQHQQAAGWVIVAERILQTAGEQQGAMIGRPFVVPADEKVRLLTFLKTETLIGGCRILILSDVAPFGVVIARLQDKSIAWRDLLFELERDDELFAVVVRPLSVLASIITFKQITGVAR